MRKRLFIFLIMKQNEKTTNWIYKPFIGKNYNKGVVGNEGQKIKIFVVGDICNLWKEYEDSEAKKIQKISYCEYLMTNESKKCIKNQTIIKDKIKTFLGKDEINLDDIIFYNFRFKNRENVPCTRDDNYKDYCEKFLKCLKKQKPTIVFGFQNLITQLKVRAVNGWKLINDYLEKNVVPKNEDGPIIRISIKNNKNEKRNIGNHGTKKLEYINDIIEKHIDFLWIHCLLSSLKKQINDENKRKTIIKNFRNLNFMPTIKEDGFEFLTTDSVKIPKKEFINAYRCVHEIKKQIKDLKEEIDYALKNADKKTAERNKMDEKIEQIKKMLTFLDTEDFYIDIGLVPSFMDYIGKNFPLEQYKKGEDVIKNFHDNKNTKPRPDARGVITRLSAICRRLHEEKDEVYLKRMYRIILKPRSLNTIYTKKDYESIHEVVHFDPDKILI